MITVKENSLLCIPLWENQSKFMWSNLKDALYQVSLKILIKRLWGNAGYQTRYSVISGKASIVSVRCVVHQICTIYQNTKKKTRQNSGNYGFW